ncbi:DNA polymerase alpha subunit B [Schizosaccharomyces pombe 972h-] [Rhizoctonia solani]|uniref:DNA polymerase alpha subunit B n=1 Tax=Rhizoctonia solani TaxID=456999 RepID=A0A0K6FR89_9AGAM|nr:DNA polymerase alpha subunit B [Schizosaccharomyces pombe 972h-] [Rhizoctonia solani]
MCRTFNITPEDLRFKWEALSFNSSLKDTPITFFTTDSASSLQQMLQREMANLGQQKASVSKPGTGKKAFRAPVAGATVSYSTPIPARRKQGGVKVEPTTPSLNGRAKAPAGPPVNYVPPQNIDSYSYRYMHEKIHDRAASLDDQIDEMAELVRKHYQLPELGDPSAVTQDEVVIVGRVVGDGDTKLGEGSVFLESSRMMGTGARTPLEFDPDLKIRCASSRGTGSTGIGLFPGMIVALKGRNGSGDSFVVSEFLRIPPLLPSLKTDVDSSLKAIIACGPYSFDSDLDYKPFATLIDTVLAERPQLLILIGPFVDSNHPLIKAGRVDDIPVDTFRHKISGPLIQLENEIPELLTVLVPSPRDLISSHVVFPQAALERIPQLGLPRRSQLVPNPSTFLVNGFRIGVTSIDVLFHIRKNEFFKDAPEVSDESSTQPADAMTMLCRQILEQQSFYPLFPVPKEVQEDVNLSVTHSNLLKMDGFAPDLLVLPSRLKEFQKVVDSTTIVNPALAAKPNSPGTAICLNISRSSGASVHSSMKVLKL